MKYNFSNLLNEIVKDYEDFEILDDGRSDYLYLKYGEKSWKFYPKTLGYDDFMLTKDLDDIKVEQYRMALFKQLGILPKLKPEQPKQEQKIQPQKQETNLPKTEQFNIKSLLQEILKNEANFKVMNNSSGGNNGVARVQNLTTKEIINFNPKDFEFSGLSDNKEISQNKIQEFKNKILEILNNIAKKELKFEIKNFFIDGDFSINKIVGASFEARRNTTGLGIAASRKAISKLKKIEFTTPVKIEMSFKSELDVTNHLYVFKIIEDRLVEKGIIKNDDDTIVKEITLKKHTDGDAAVIVKISEI